MPCSVLASILPELPPFLDCSDDEIFLDDCDQDSRLERARFDSSSSCVAPLMLTETSSAYWPEVEECGF